MPKAKPRKAKTVAKPVYPKVFVELFGGKDACQGGKGPMTLQQMKEVLGWEELPDKPKGDPAKWEADGGVGKTVKKTIIKDGKRITVVETAKPINPRKGDWQGKAAKAFEEELFRDLNGKRVVLRNNSTNRPFRMGLAKRYMNDILRRKWFLNGESFIVDCMGKVQSGQHRGVGFILACQAWRKERDAKAAGASPGEKHDPSQSVTPGGWAKYWSSEPVWEGVIVRGVSNRPEVIDSIDQGQKRTGGDVFYRQERFPGLKRAERSLLTRWLAQAARLVWLRQGGQWVSNAPHLPMSELVEFVNDHPKLEEWVAYIWQLNKGKKGDRRGVEKFISPPYAAGLGYLMAVSGTDPDEYLERGSDVLDFDMEVKAMKFWRLLASGGEDGVPSEEAAKAPVFNALKDVLVNIDAGSGQGRDELCGAVIKAFNRWAENPTGKCSIKDVEVHKEPDPELHNKLMVDEEPRLGGIDVERVKEKPKAPARKGRGRKASLGEAEQPAKGKSKGKGGKRVDNKRREAESEEPRAKSGKGRKAAKPERRPSPRRQRDGADEHGRTATRSNTTRRAASELPVGEMAGDKWAVGDKCWVLEPDEAPYFGTIETISDDGKKAFVTNDADGKDWECSVKWLSLVHPDA